MENKENSASKEEIDKVISTLSNFLDNPDQLYDLTREKREELMILAGKLSRPDKKEKQNRVKEIKKAEARKKREREKHARKETGIRSAREDAVFVAPKLLEIPKERTNKSLESARNCYVCKEEFTELHHFYDTMCESCGDFNYAKRFQTADMKTFLFGKKLFFGTYQVNKN